MYPRHKSQDILVALDPEKRQDENLLTEGMALRNGFFRHHKLAWLALYNPSRNDRTIPYLPASGSGAGPGPGSERPPLCRMAFHYWLAPPLALGSFVHAWIPMASHHMPRTNFNGLWLATFALGLMVVQLGLGVALRFLRRGHFTLMLGITALVLLHLWMNSPLLRAKL